MRDLARRLAEHPRWPWQPGMGCAQGWIVIAERGDGEAVLMMHESNRFPVVVHEPGELTPDLDHPATKGWLLAMLREATGQRLLSARFTDGGWWFWSEAPRGSDTEGEALARALLAAWGDE